MSNNQKLKFKINKYLGFNNIVYNAMQDGKTKDIVNCTNDVEVAKTLFDNEDYEYFEYAWDYFVVKDLPKNVVRDLLIFCPEIEESRNGEAIAVSYKHILIMLSNSAKNLKRLSIVENIEELNDLVHTIAAKSGLMEMFDCNIRQHIIEQINGECSNVYYKKVFRPTADYIQNMYPEILILDITFLSADSNIKNSIGHGISGSLESIFGERIQSSILDIEWIENEGFIPYNRDSSNNEFHKKLAKDLQRSLADPYDISYDNYRQWIIDGAMAE